MESMNNVEKTLIHISHLHPLNLVVSPEPKPLCHACYVPCADQSFGCIDCNYFLHMTCATTKRSMDHPSHPAHTLKLELTSPHVGKLYRCSGCGIDGITFGLGCRQCSYDLHLPCAAIPHQVMHHSHHHQLVLSYKNPYPSGTVGTCRSCKKFLDLDRWFYLCATCDFGGHVGCFSPDKLEVLSPGLQEQHAPPPPQQSQPQPQLHPHGAAQVGNKMDPVAMIYRQILGSNISADRLRNIGL